MKILFDMDGVVCDFVQAAINVHNLPVLKKDCQWNFYKQFFPNEKEFWNKFDFNFWKNMLPHSDGVDLLYYLITNYNYKDIYFCSTPTLNTGCIDGKITWIKDMFPKMSRQYIFTEHKDVIAHKNILLIDDRNENVDKFIKAGGHGILIPRPWNNRSNEIDEMCNFHLTTIVNEIERYLNA